MKLEIKKFSELTVGDIFYEVFHENMEYTTKEVQKVEGDKIYHSYGGSNSIPRFKTTSGEVKEYSRYSDGRQTHYFTSEAEVIRFCKARLMKELFKRIESAKKAIGLVVELRNNNYQLLNHEWTERQINVLEKSF